MSIFESDENDQLDEMWDQDPAEIGVDNLNVSEFTGAADGGDGSLAGQEATALGAAGTEGADAWDPPNRTTPEAQHFTLEDMVARMGRKVQELDRRMTRLEQIQVERQAAAGATMNPLQTRPWRGASVIGRFHLDQVCLPVLEQTYDVTQAQLSRIAERLERLYPSLERRSINSAIRRWFRKRREGMAVRLISAVRRRFPEELRHQGSVRTLQRRVAEDQVDLTAVIEDARLETLDAEKARVFAKEKILSFLRRLKP